MPFKSLKRKAEISYLLFLRRHRINLTFSCHLIILKIFIVGGNLVDEGSVRKKLNDAVCSGLDNLVVTGSEEDNARELNQTVV